MQIKNMFSVLTIALLLLQLQTCGQEENLGESETFSKMKNNQTNATKGQIDTATFAAGCFWCVEGQFQQLVGVTEIKPGYIGGQTVNPTYKEVCTGSTGHAEACNIMYDPSIISYDELLAAFFVAHNPTQLNRQGNDVGTQYRSAIFYHNQEQKEKATYYIKALNEEKAYSKPIVTQVESYGTFYKAENYHEDYYKNNPEQSYCKFVIKPEIENFRKVFKDKVKNEEPN